MFKIHSDHNRFYIGDDAQHPKAFISYTVIEPSIWRIDHTVVSSELRNQGIAKQLTLHLIEEATKNNIKLIPLCSYSQSFFKRYSQYQSLLTK